MRVNRFYSGRESFCIFSQPTGTGIIEMSCHIAFVHPFQKVFAITDGIDYNLVRHPVREKPSQ
jgi:hypothetical protein